MGQKNEIATLDSQGTIAESTMILREMVKRSTTATQLDIILTVIALSKGKDEFFEYQIPLSDFYRLIYPSNPRRSDRKKAVMQALDRLMDCHFWLHSTTESASYHFVKYVKVNHVEEVVKIKISDEMIPFFLQIQGDMTFYTIKDVLVLHTLFQKNVFLWLMAFCEYKRPVHISIDDAKLSFNGEDEIKTFKFIEKLDDAVATISQLTPLHVTYTKIKKGKSITTLAFSIKKQLPAAKDDALSDDESDNKRKRKRAQYTQGRIEKLTQERDIFRDSFIQAVEQMSIQNKKE